MIELTWLSAGDGAANPGSGNVTFNAVPWLSVTQIAVSTADKYLNNIAPWLDGLATATNPVKALLRLQKLSNPAAWVEFAVEDVTIASASHRTLQVTTRAQGAAFFNLDVVGMTAAQSGDQGPQGNPGINGTDGTDGLDAVTPAPQWTYSAATTVGTIGAGAIGFNHTDPKLATALLIDDTDRFGNSRVPFIQRFDDAINPDYRSIITLYKTGQESTFIVWKCTGPVVLSGGVYSVPGVWDSSATVTPVPLDFVAVDLFQPGGKGDTGLTGATGAPGTNGTNGAPFDPALLYGTSATAVPVALGPATFVATTQRIWQVGQRLRAALPDLSLIMEGPISSYSKTTGTLTIAVDFKKGIGSGNNWILSLAGEIGATGNEGVQGPQGTAGAPGAVGAAGPTGAAGAPGADATPVDTTMFWGTSTTGVTVGDGLKVFVTQLNRVWVKGQRVRASSFDASRIIEGPVSEYHPDTGNLSIAADYFVGAGLHNEWWISVAGARGLSGDQGPPGVQGDVGSGLAYQASGTLAQRAAYDTQPQGFGYLQTDVVPFNFWVKASSASADWAGPTPIESPTQLDEIVPIGAVDYDEFVPLLATATTDLGAVNSNLIELGGAGTNITSFGIANGGVFRFVRLNGTPNLIYNAVSMILPGGANIACLPNDTFLALSLGGGNWVVTQYSRGAVLGVSVELGNILPIGAIKWAPFADVATALNMNLGAVASNQLRFTGSVTVGSFGTANDGVWRQVILSAAVQINHSAALILPGAANIAGAIGDAFLAVSRGAGNWQVISYQRANGAPTSAATTTELLTGTDALKPATPDAIAALWEMGTPVASAALVTLGEGGFFHITGAVAITDIDFATPKDGRMAWLIFDTGGALLTYNATTLKIPGLASITTQAGDRCLIVQDAADNITVLAYFWNSVSPLFYATTTTALTGTAATGAITADALAALWEKGANVASAGVLSLGEGGFFHVTGTTTITDIDFAVAKDGRMAWLEFDGVLALIHNATTLNIPGGISIRTAVGDRALVVQDVTDNVHVLAYVRANGLAVADTALITKNAAYTLTADDDGKTFLLDGTAAAFNVTLPDALANPGFRVSFVRTDAVVANGVQILAAGAQTIEGAAAVTLECQGRHRTLVSDGIATWHHQAGTAASTAKPGEVMLAATTDVLTGTDAAKAVTPDALAALWERGTDVVAAASLVLGDGGYFVVSGGTGITGITFATAKSGRRAWLYFGGAPLLTHSANFILPGFANYQVAAGDRLELIYDGGTQYRALQIVRIDGAVLPVGLASTTDVLTGTNATKAVTPDALAALWEWGGTIAAAAAMTLPDGGYFNISGAATITDIDFTVDKAGRTAWMVFYAAGAILTHSATLILPGAANITTAVGDRMLIISDGSDIIRCLAYVRADGSVVPGAIASTTEVLTGTNALKGVTPDALAALWEEGTPVASAATVSLGEGGFFHVTGTVTITDIDFAVAKDGRTAWVIFDGSLTLTHNATTLVLPGGANIVTQAGDRACFVQDNADNVICVSYERASGKPTIPPTAAEVPFTPAGNIAATDVQAAIAEVASERFGHNKIINGDFRIDQRNGGANQSVGAGVTSQYAMDRWKGASGQAPGAFDIRRIASGSGWYCNLIVTAADAALAVTDYYLFGQKIEGLNLTELQWGTANAKPITISFNASADKAYTLPISVRNAANNRSWIGTIAVTTTSQRFSLTVPGDTTGTWLYDNGLGLDVEFGLGAGTNFQGAAGWSAGNFITHSTASNFMAAINNQLNIGDFQVEVGSVATDFERRLFGHELLLCQRYFWKRLAAATPERIATGYAFGANQSANTLRLPTRMRALPTMIAFGLQANGQDSTGAAASSGSEDALGFNVSTAAGIAAGDGVGVTLKTAASSYIQADAEL